MIARKIVRFWLFVALTLIGFWVVCYIGETYGGNADGLLGSIIYTNIFASLLLLTGLGFLLSLGLTARQKIIQNLSLSGVSALFCLFLLESVGHLILGFKLIKSAPFTFRRFYIPSDVTKLKPYPAGDLNPVAGRGHVPGGAYKFVTCQGDSICWFFNSAGAHDRQRSVSCPALTKKRVAFIGDSFLEGYMVNSADRCSDILEKKTGIEHLNFAVNGSNPLNYYLTYTSLAKKYETDVLVIGFLPANDFETQSEQNAYKLVEWPVYAPYWQGKYPEYSLKYSLASVSQSINHGNHTQASLAAVVDSIYSTLSFSGKLKANLLAYSSIFRLLGELHANSYREGHLTRFGEFTNDEWNRVSYSLTKLIADAKGKKIILLSIPTLWDLKALISGKPNRIDPLLAGFCRQNKVGFIPLTPAFLSYRGNLQELYVRCDGHWSVQGEAYAATSLLKHPVYRTSLGLHY